MATVDAAAGRPARYTHTNGLELDENASDESDFFLVRTVGGGDVKIGSPTAQQGGAGAAAGPAAPPQHALLPAPVAVVGVGIHEPGQPRTDSPSFSNTVTSPPVVSSLTRKRKIEKEEKDCTEREGRKTRTEPGVGVPMVFGRQYLRTETHAEGDKMPHWHPIGDVDQGLAADFDDSLSGLGVNLAATTYNMSEALLALPNISNMSTLLKNEAASLPASDNCSMSQGLESPMSGGGWRDVPGSEDTAPSGGAPTTAGVGPTPVPPPRTAATAAVVLGDAHKRQQHRFQYVLNAATSIATKVNEETLTYLNQGQSYEIRIKKLGDLTSCSDTTFLTRLKLCFHERRLQYIEKEQLEAWRTARPGDRLLEVDMPLSYGIFDVRQDPTILNCCEFSWNPNKDVGVYVKVHSVSTEFTPKKHGGEKGVPFRIQAETFAGGGGSGEPPGPLLHLAASQVKVFKLKGADRKHKQDRERIMKRPVSELERYQPSYDCTVLTEMPLELAYTPQQRPAAAPTPAAVAGERTTPPPAAPLEPEPRAHRSHAPTAEPVRSHAPSHAPGHAPPPPPPEAAQHGSQPSSSPTDSANDDDAAGRLAPGRCGGGCVPETGSADLLTARAGCEQTQAWLLRQRFGAHAAALANFTGADLMRMSRDDVVQLCGLADGVRLYNCLHNKLILPRLTIYVSEMESALHHAFYLYQTSRSEVTRKLAGLLGCGTGRVRQVCVEGPGGVPVLLTDEVVRHLQNESLYKMESLPVPPDGDRVDLLLHRTRATSGHFSDTPPPPPPPRAHSRSN